jgi:hypothetical protein
MAQNNASLTLVIHNISLEGILENKLTLFVSELQLRQVLLGLSQYHVADI